MGVFVTPQRRAAPTAHTGYRDFLETALSLLDRRGPTDTGTLCVIMFRDSVEWERKGSGRKLLYEAMRRMARLKSFGYVTSDKDGSWWRITDRGRERMVSLHASLANGICKSGNGRR